MAPTANSVAVLYFENRSRDTADTYLAEGITDAIATRLGQVGRLTVKSQAAVRPFRGAAANDPGAVARALGVANFVSGSVQRAGSRLLVTVELVRAATGDRLWGSQYDRSDANLLAIQEDIATAVATAIAGRLLPQERAAIAAQPTRSAEAYDHFLRGNYQLARRSPSAAARAIEEYEAALRIDPRFAAPKARIGLAYGIVLSWGWELPGVPPESLLARAGAAAEAAVRLDSTSAEAWLALASLNQERDLRTYATARAAVERAIALDPRNAEAHHMFAVTLARTGDDAEAVREEQAALALEPARAISLFWMARFSTRRREYAEARRWCDSAISVEPSAYYAYATRSWARLALGDTAGARTDAETAVRVSPPGYVYWGEGSLVSVAAAEGDTGAARNIIGRLRERIAALPHASSISATLVARALTEVGDWNSALDLLEQGRNRGVELWWEITQPWVDPLRSNPRFQRLVEETRPPGAPR